MNEKKSTIDTTEVFPTLEKKKVSSLRLKCGVRAGAVVDRCRCDARCAIRCAITTS